MCQTICKSKKSKFFIASDCNPQTIAVCQVPNKNPYSASLRLLC